MILFLLIIIIAAVLFFGARMLLWSRSISAVEPTPFPQLCQQIAHRMLSAGKTWDEIDTVLRYEATRELMPKGAHSAEQLAAFYTLNFQQIDGLWLRAVLRMKQDYQRMTDNPDDFLRELGMLPPTPVFSQQIADIVNRLPPKKA
jgi:hypothetical protein